MLTTIYNNYILSQPVSKANTILPHSGRLARCGSAAPRLRCACKSRIIFCMKRAFLHFLRALAGLLSSAALLTLTGCAGKAGRNLFALDTYIQLTAYGRGASAALADCDAEIQRLESLLSVTRVGGDVFRINQANGAAVSVEPETAALLSEARRLAALTGGAFDPTVYPLMRLWGFGDSPAVPEPAAIAALLPLVDAERLSVDGVEIALPAGAGIDLGGIAKGYVSDRLAALLQSRGIESAMLTLGGNVHALGSKPNGDAWRVGIQDPQDANAVAGVIDARDCAVITSGSYQRYFEENGVRYHHILNPATGYPADSGLCSVTVIAKSGVEADALSTALFVMGAENAIAFWRQYGGFAFVLITTDGELLYSENAPFSAADGYAARPVPASAS